MGRNRAKRAGARRDRFLSSETETKKNIVAAVKVTPKCLGNRPATCRNDYVHLAVLDAYADGTLLPAMPYASEHHSNAPETLRREEICVMAVIEKRQQRAPNLDFLSGAALRQAQAP